jgi:hypothetical protein
LAGFAFSSVFGFEKTDLNISGDRAKRIKPINK